MFKRLYPLESSLPISYFNLVISSDLTLASIFQHHYHCVKVVRIRSYSGPYFPAFGLNTKRYGASLCIHTECGKIRTRVTPNTDTFHAMYFLYIETRIRTGTRIFGGLNLLLSQGDTKSASRFAS